MADERRQPFSLSIILVFLSFSTCSSSSEGFCEAIDQDSLPKRIPVRGFIAVCLHGNQQWILHKLWSVVKVSLVSFTNGSNIEGNFIRANSCEAVLEGRESSGISRFILSFLPSGPFMKYRANEIQLSPFTNTCLGVAADNDDDLRNLNLSHILHIKLTAIHYWFPLMFITGLLLFSYSDKLSRNVMFFYSTGISVGVFASFLIGVFVLSRLIPGRNLAYVSLAGGWSLTLAGLTWVLRNIFYLLQQHFEWVICYMTIAGLISFVVCYYYGPPKDERSLDLICWFIQLVALVFLYQSTQSKEVSIALVIIVFLSKFIIFSKALRIFTSIALLRWLPYKLQYTLFLPKHRLLTEDEYRYQGHVETRKALDELRQYCSSPECDTWKTVCRLKTPGRFAEFVSTGKHFNEEEVRSYEFVDEDSSYSLFTELEESELEEEYPACSFLDNKT